MSIKFISRQHVLNYLNTKSKVYISKFSYSILEENIHFILYPYFLAPLNFQTLIELLLAKYVLRVISLYEHMDSIMHNYILFNLNPLSRQYNPVGLHLQ
jgi:hypothetical protein